MNVMYVRDLINCHVIDDSRTRVLAWVSPSPMKWTGNFPVIIDSLNGYEDSTIKSIFHYNEYYNRHIDIPDTYYSDEIIVEVNKIPDTLYKKIVDIINELESNSMYSKRNTIHI